MFSDGHVKWHSANNAMKKLVDEDATVTVKPPGRAGLDAGASAASTNPIPGYKILKELHRGGQGIVYQAVDPDPARDSRARAYAL